MAGLVSDEAEPEDMRFRGLLSVRGGNEDNVHGFGSSYEFSDNGDPGCLPREDDTEVGGRDSGDAGDECGLDERRVTGFQRGDGGD